jgi:hypothetical protein
MKLEGQYTYSNLDGDSDGGDFWSSEVAPNGTAVPGMWLHIFEKPSYPKFLSYSGRVVIITHDHSEPEKKEKSVVKMHIMEQETGTRYCVTTIYNNLHVRYHYAKTGVQSIRQNLYHGAYTNETVLISEREMLIQDRCQTDIFRSYVTNGYLSDVWV